MAGEVKQLEANLMDLVLYTDGKLTLEQAYINTPAQNNLFAERFKSFSEKRADAQKASRRSR